MSYQAAKPCYLLVEVYQTPGCIHWYAEIVGSERIAYPGQFLTILTMSRRYVQYEVRPRDVSFRTSYPGAPRNPPPRHGSHYLVWHGFTHGELRTAWTAILFTRWLVFLDWPRRYPPCCYHPTVRRHLQDRHKG